MAFKRPTLSELVTRAKSDIATRLSGADANLPGSFEEVVSICLAGLTHGLHGHIKWLSKQIMTDKSDEEYLLRDADVHGVDRIAAVKATGTATITGTNGTTCPDGTLWVRGDGVEYEQQGDATISGGEATITLEAAEAGADANCDAGTKLTIGSAVAGITSQATIVNAIDDGADIEEVEDLRDRVLDRKRRPPNGGGPGAYEQWAREVSGVTRAWEFGGMMGAGTVVLYFVRDDDVSIIPDAGEVTTVQTYIDSVAPITADVIVAAPTASPLNFTFTTISPNTAAVKAAVEAELEALIRDLAEPGGTIYLSQIREAISAAAGEENYVMTSPAADVTEAAGAITTMGTVTWP